MLRETSLRRGLAPWAAIALLATATLVALPLEADAAARPSCDGDAATLVGTKGKDRLVGTEGRDVIVGLGGNDVIRALGGEDLVCAGPGDDTVDGGADNDTLHGDAGDDHLRSGSGTDGFLSGGAGDDELVGEDTGVALFGDAGDDWLTGEKSSIQKGGRGEDRLTGSDEADLLWGGPHDDVIDAGAGDDVRVYGDAGNDRLAGGLGLDIMEGGAGNDRMNSGTGTDGFLYGEAGNDRLVGMDVGTALDGGEGNDTLVGYAATIQKGGPGNDTLTGSDEDDLLWGGAGRDRIDAAGGDDVRVYGEAGNDALSGGNGDDRLEAGDGDDTCSGGPGIDTCDGGSPGGPANTPEDADLCDDTAEQKVSCRGDAAFPDRWLVHVDGVWENHFDDTDETGGWTLDIVLRRGGAPDETWYVFESGTGSWHYEGASDDGFTSCTWSGSGGIDPEWWSADLTLVPEEKLYFLDYAAQGIGTHAGECHNKDYSDSWEEEGQDPFKMWEDTGEGELVPWDPDTLQMHGTESHQVGGEQWTQTWTVTPYDDPVPGVDVDRRVDW